MMDTSALVAALIEDHQHHALSRRHLVADIRLPAIVVAETFAQLRRTFGQSAATATAVVSPLATGPGTVLPTTASAVSAVLARAVELDLGGNIHDALDRPGVRRARRAIGDAGRSTASARPGARCPEHLPARLTPIWAAETPDSGPQAARNENWTEGRPERTGSATINRWVFGDGTVPRTPIGRRLSAVPRRGRGRP